MPRQQDDGAAERPRHIADEPLDTASDPDATVKSPTTSTGLPVEEQIHKEWDPNKNGGLPQPLRGADPR